jgi:hypothetical protein
LQVKNEGNEEWEDEYEGKMVKMKKIKKEKKRRKKWYMYNKKNDDMKKKI